MLVQVYDTAGAAKMVAEKQDPSVAAIASLVAAERYGLAVLPAPATCYTSARWTAGGWRVVVYS